MGFHEELNVIRRRAGLQEQARDTLYHGTSKAALEKILAGSTQDIIRVYQESNVSLGGAYLTRNITTARYAAKKAAKTHNSAPVVVEVKLIYPLLPDEDWVVDASEHPHEEDFDWDSETWLDSRYQGFFDELFASDVGGSLSDTYRDNYDELNHAHDITWGDSMNYIGSVRQEQPLSPQQIMGEA